MNNCLECGKETRNPKFCSRSCSAKYTNREKPRIKNLSPIVPFCIVCGKKLTGEQKWKRGKYCSRRCSVTKRIDGIISSFLAGNYKKQRLSPTIRRYLIDRVEKKCERCGWSGINQKTGSSVLQVHHKDGNGENHVLSNIEIICPNCHAMTKTFGSLNNGSGRKDRRDKYRESHGLLV